jgi:hypothetical protein
MTWKAITEATLQKLFAADSGGVVREDVVRAYAPGFAGAANEGISLLCLAGRPLVRSIAVRMAELPAAGRFRRLELRGAATDFRALEGVPPGCRLEGEGVLLLPEGGPAEREVRYFAYHEPITQDTPGEYEPALAPEAAVLLPLYMASQLCKDDNLSLSSQYRAEFERGLDALRRAHNARGQAGFECATGWWEA